MADSPRDPEQMDRDELVAEVLRLRALVGDENQSGWENCSRAEAIRQAEQFHEAMLKWIRAHDERRDERDRALDMAARATEQAGSITSRIRNMLDENFYG